MRHQVKLIWISEHLPTKSEITCHLTQYVHVIAFGALDFHVLKTIKAGENHFPFIPRQRKTETARTFCAHFTETRGPLNKTVPTNICVAEKEINKTARGHVTPHGPAPKPEGIIEFDPAGTNEHVSRSVRFESRHTHNGTTSEHWRRLQLRLDIHNLSHSSGGRTTAVTS